MNVENLEQKELYEKLSKEAKKKILGKSLFKRIFFFGKTPLTICFPVLGMVVGMGSLIILKHDIILLLSIPLRICLITASALGGAVSAFVAMLAIKAAIAGIAVGIVQIKKLFSNNILNEDDVITEDKLIVYVKKEYKRTMGNSIRKHYSSIIPAITLANIFSNNNLSLEEKKLRINEYMRQLDNEDKGAGPEGIPHTFPRTDPINAQTLPSYSIGVVQAQPQSQLQIGFQQTLPLPSIPEDNAVPFIEN